MLHTFLSWYVVIFVEITNYMLIDSKDFSNDNGITS